MRFETSTSTTLCTLMIVLFVLTLPACGGSNLRRTPTAERDTPWFCQMNEARDNWECVQDAELARRPKPERLPGDEPPLPEPERIPLIAPTVIFEEETASLNEETAVDAPTTAATAAAIATAETPATDDAAPTLSEPEEDDLLSMSPDLYAVQLIAMANESVADDFKSHHNIDDALIVQLATEGELFYVVLLGIYDSFTDAEQAVAERGESLSDIEPWIRPLDTIQSGLREAQRLIASRE
jgi:septal ring-binding cell division protein DamX